ncbi:MAG TPA: helix-turn-helix domain-containing protein [Nitrososphaeraceae archaeon]|nr:helix-turn-helix domain-containing protein [Nitrososphaeraceae archaeon]
MKYSNGMFNNNNNYDIPSYTEECIIQHWLQGKTRDEIAQAFGISKGTVSNIIAKFRNKLGHRDFDAMRELAKQLLRQNMTLDNCAIGFRVSNIMKKLGISEAKTEEFLTTVFEFAQKKGISPEILREDLIEFYKISETIPFSEISIYLQKMMEEIEETENKKNQVKEEIQTLEKDKLAKEEQVRSGLREANTTLFHLNNYIETKFKLAKFGIIVEDIDRFTRCVEGIGRYSNYDPFKVIEKFSDREALEIGIENNQKIKNNLEINIQKLKETESEYNDRLNLKYIKLKNLDELEKIVGFTIQDLKKLKGILMEIALEHKNLNIEQLKAIFFELVEKLEDRIALEKENNTKMKLNLLLENQIKSKR